MRGADEPRLPSFELDRITQAQKSYRKWLKTNPTPYQKMHVRDSDVRLVLDLQAYLKLASRDRDSTILREMLAQEDFAAAMEVVLEPVVQLLKRTYRVGNGAQAVADLQKFVEQLITGASSCPLAFYSVLSQLSLQWSKPSEVECRTRRRASALLRDCSNDTSRTCTLSFTACTGRRQSLRSSSSGPGASRSASLVHYLADGVLPG